MIVVLHVGVRDIKSLENSVSMIYLDEQHFTIEKELRLIHLALAYGQERALYKYEVYT